MAREGEERMEKESKQGEGEARRDRGLQLSSSVFKLILS